MPGRLEGKVAFITGAARGQGRSHAIRLAEEGADIIAVDICHQIASNVQPLAMPEDLEQTVAAVKQVGRHIVARHADVRERSSLAAAIEVGLHELGRLDIVVANAGVMPMGATDVMDFVDVTDVDLTGVMNTVAAALPSLPDGASIVLTGSTAGLMDATNSDAMGPGGSGYAWAKQALVSYSERMALSLARRMIRINVIHPTNCNTPPLHNEELYKLFRPDLEHPTKQDVIPAFTHFQAMPIPWVEPVDISNAVLFFASDESRYVTGQQLRVDGGSLLRWPKGPQAH